MGLTYDIAKYLTNKYGDEIIKAIEYVRNRESKKNEPKEYKILNLLGCDCCYYDCQVVNEKAIIFIKINSYLACTLPHEVQDDLFAEIISKIERFDYEFISHLNI